MASESEPTDQPTAASPELQTESEKPDTGDAVGDLEYRAPGSKKWKKQLCALESGTFRVMQQTVRTCFLYDCNTYSDGRGYLCFLKHVEMEGKCFWAVW